MSGKAVDATVEHIDASSERTNRLLQGACVIAQQRLRISAHRGRHFRLMVDGISA